MVLKALALLLLAVPFEASSVSHVSFTFGNNKPIEYELSPSGNHYPRPQPNIYSPRPTHAPRPTYSPQPTYAPRPPTYATSPAPMTPARKAYTPPEVKYPPKTHAPSYEPLTSPAPTYPPSTTASTTTTTTTTTTTPAPPPPPSTYPPAPVTTTHAPSTTEAPVYHSTPVHHSQPVYHPQPPAPHYPVPVPACASNSTKTYCLEDEEYPSYQIKHAIDYHFSKVIDLYADVADLNTELSVERPEALEEETYLCPSETAYVRPLRAQNTDGTWRIIVNAIEAHYRTFTQTTRVEECQTSGEPCPLVPYCYESTCLQKFAYHRFLVYDAYDQYFPFAIETFKLPASCACTLGAYAIDH